VLAGGPLSAKFTPWLKPLVKRHSVYLLFFYDSAESLALVLNVGALGFFSVAAVGAEVL